jgi:hypothetical protein
MSLMDLTCCANTEGLVTITTPGDPDVDTPCNDPDGRWHMWEAGVAKLWHPPKLRGANRLIPQLAGKRSYRRFIDERQVSCPMTFQAVDPDDPSALLRAAIDEFYDAVVVPLTDGDGTRILTVVSADESRTRSGPVTIEDLAETADPESGPGWACQDFELVVTIPGGRLALL